MSGTPRGTCFKEEAETAMLSTAHGPRIMGLDKRPLDYATCRPLVTDTKAEAAHGEFGDRKLAEEG